MRIAAALSIALLVAISAIALVLFGGEEKAASTDKTPSENAPTVSKYTGIAIDNKNDETETIARSSLLSQNPETEADAGASQNAKTVLEPLKKGIRTVGPANSFSPTLFETETIARLPAFQPPKAVPKVEETEEQETPEVQPIRLIRPIAKSAGILQVGDRSFLLKGIKVTAMDETCNANQDASNQDQNEVWPCGMRARTAFRSYLRGRAVVCDVLPEWTKKEPEPTQCRLQNADIAEWLVRQGWAKPKGDAYRAVAKEAKSGKLGLWGAGR